MWVDFDYFLILPCRGQWESRFSKHMIFSLSCILAMVGKTMCEKVGTVPRVEEERVCGLLVLKLN
jgi:hypothetical protein